MTKKLDRRTAYTRMVIKESLYKLLEKKHLSEITVKELCAQADINRTTFYRNYMEYHADRFKDCSLIVLDEKERVVAVFPASKNKSEIESHGGLTFGGFITNEKMSVSDMLTIFEKM